MIIMSSVYPHAPQTAAQSVRFQHQELDRWVLASGGHLAGRNVARHLRDPRAGRFGPFGSGRGAFRPRHPTISDLSCLHLSDAPCTRPGDGTASGVRSPRNTSKSAKERFSVVRDTCLDRMKEHQLIIGDLSQSLHHWAIRWHTQLHLRGPIDGIPHAHDHQPVNGMAEEDPKRFQGQKGQDHQAHLRGSGTPSGREDTREVGPELKPGPLASWLGVWSCEGQKKLVGNGWKPWNIYETHRTRDDKTWKSALAKGSLQCCKAQHPAEAKHSRHWSTSDWPQIRLHQTRLSTSRQTRCWDSVSYSSPRRVQPPPARPRTRSAWWSTPSAHSLTNHHRWSCPQSPPSWRVRWWPRGAQSRPRAPGRRQSPRSARWPHVKRHGTPNRNSTCFWEIIQMLETNMVQSQRNYMQECTWVMFLYLNSCVIWDAWPI